MTRRGDVLIVRHGPGRGREVVTLEPALQRLAVERPQLPAAIRFHETGGGPTPDLAGVRAVFFWLADPLRERYPACFEEAQEIAQRAQARGIRLANPPEALSHTIKSEQARRWAEAGIPTPRHVAFADRSELEEKLAGFDGPVLLKAEHLHAQRGMWVFASGAEARRSLDRRKIAYPGAIAEFVDTRAGFGARRPGSVWSRFFHKKRALVLGELVSPRSVLFSESPIVSLKTCTFRPPTGWRKAGYGLRGEVRACVRADLAWWRTGGEHHDVMRHAAKALGLDVCGIDYASTADGGVVLWEANPFFYLPLRRSYLLPWQRGFERRYRGFIRDLGDFLEALR
ncbi:MAG TPA: hypothetical protein VII72_00955 [Myxococcota bacterium]|jgi:hypothetical protein